MHDGLLLDFYFNLVRLNFLEVSLNQFILCTEVLSNMACYFSTLSDGTVIYRTSTYCFVRSNRPKSQCLSYCQSVVSVVLYLIYIINKTC